MVDPNLIFHFSLDNRHHRVEAVKEFSQVKAVEFSSSGVVDQQSGRRGTNQAGG